MADKTRTKDATVGTVNSKPVNRSASDVRAGMSVQRKNATGGFLEAATANHSANIQENLGFQGHPVATLYAANAAEAAQTQRSTRFLAPVMDRSGNGGNFGSARGDSNHA